MGTSRSFSGFKDTDTDTYASATWTANRAIESGADGKLAASAVTKAELSYLTGSTSNIQAQLDAKGTYTLPTLAANVAVVTNAAGDLANGGASVTELGYLAGATSNIQAQLNTKMASTVITDWAVCTFTGSWSANTTYVAKYKLIGDTAFVQGEIQLAGAPTSAGLVLTLPTGWNMDTTKLPSTSTNMPVGYGAILDATTAHYPVVQWIYTTANTLTGYYGLQAGAADVQASTITQAAPITFANNDRVYFILQFPVTIS